MLTKKAEKAAKDYARRTPPENRCVAKVTSGDQVRPGPYNLLPVICGIHKGKTTNFVLLTAFLLRISDDAHVGNLNWVLPLNTNTEVALTKLLVSLGWDGRVWPEEPGWPGEGSKEAEGLQALVKGQNLHGTMTFPPDPENGNATLRQDILRTSADFPLSPELEEGVGVEPSPEMVEKLRKLAADPQAFFGVGISTFSGI